MTGWFSAGRIACTAMAVSLLAAPGSAAAEEPGIAAPSHRIALLVAADATPEKKGVTGAVDRSERLGALLRSRYGFSEVVELYGEDATGAVILRRLTGLQAKMGRDSALLLSLSLPVHTDFGRAIRKGVSQASPVPSRDNHYWVPWDGRTGDPYSLIRVTDMLTRITDGSPSGWVLGVLDTCLVWATEDPGGPGRWLEQAFSRRAGGTVIDHCPASADAVEESFVVELLRLLSIAADRSEALVVSDLVDALSKRLQEQGVLVRTGTFGRRPDFLLQPVAGALEAQWRELISQDNLKRVANMNELAGRVRQQPSASRAPLARDAADLFLDIATDNTESEQIRQRAIFYLGRTEHPVAAAKIIEAFGRLNEAVQETAITSLSRYSQPEVVSFLERSIDSATSGIRSRAVDGLAQLGSVSSLPKILRRLSREGDDNVAVSLLNSVMTLKAESAQAFDPVASAVTRRGAGVEVRKTGIRVLSTFGDSRAEEPLIELLQTTTEPEIRQSAAFTLGQLEGPSDRRIEVLAGLLARDPSRSVRQTAAVSLGTAPSPRALEALMGGLQDSEATVRAAAAESLGKLGDRSAAAYLVEALADDSSAVRRNAAVALGELKATDSAPALLTAAQRDPDLFVRQAAEAAIGELDLDISEIRRLDPSWYNALDPAGRAERLREIGGSTSYANYELALDSLRDSEEVVRQAAIEALASVPASFESRLVDELRSLARGPYFPPGAIEAVAVLGRLQSENALRALVELLELVELLGPGHDFLHPVILASLGEHTRVDALEAVEASLTSGDQRLRVAAARAMGRQGELLFERGEPAGRALQRISKALDGLRSPASDPIAEGRLLIQAGRIQRAAGDAERAQSRFFEALDVLARSREQPASNVARADALKELADLLPSISSDKGQIEKMLLEAVALEEAVLPPGHPELEATLRRVAAFYREMGDEETADYYATLAEGERRR